MINMAEIKRDPKLFETCNEVHKKIDDLTIDLKTGRVLQPEELSKDELEELVNLQHKLIVFKCNCVSD